MGKEPLKRRVFLDFTNRELRVIGLVSFGWDNGEIAEMEGCTRDGVKHLVLRVYRKAGIRHNHAALTRWAIEHCLDLPLEPEPIEAKPPRVSRKINLGRMKGWAATPRRRGPLQDFSKS